ncbi:MAG: hypothetical protein LJD31_00565 [Wolbachia endosymbiont of Menacanthus eurysternus]|nr:hypothetical protein [Wolbachia endosymbiont of Menacanthus eurysternus]
MVKHIFNIVCTDDTVGDSSIYKKIKLVEEQTGKTIKFCGPYIGAYSICERDGQESFELWVEKAKYNFREGDFCDSWTDRKLYYKENIPLGEVKLKVILDEDCEYKIAVSVGDDQWITLPKSSLFGENLNLGEYYNQKLNLLKGEVFTRYTNGSYHIPKVMYGKTEICKLSPFSFPRCNESNIEMGSVSRHSLYEARKVVIEKNHEGGFLIYFANGNGISLSKIQGGAKDVVNEANSVLKAVLLENSNIREVLPELNIGDDVDIDKRQLKCLVHNVVPKEVAQELVTRNKDALGRAVLEAKNGNEEILVTKVASDKGLQEAIAGNQVLKDAVTTALSSDDGFHNIVKRLTDANNAKQKFTLQKGEKLLDDVYEANVVLNGKNMATLPKIGYYMLNDQLVMHNHVTKEKVVIPEDFHFLKVVKLYNDDYKLTFCNVFGNEFFEYKKYDPQYSNVSDEYKFISLNYAKKEYHPNLSELFGHRPSFFITEGPAEPGSPGHYQADVFELKNNKKGRKIATLIDKFCYFNENDQFKCCNYHKGMECRIYDTSEINQEYRITDANSKFSLLGYDDVILHTIPELI